jgi:UDP:flavonoid glycosyltransferase YjiC (YdhE family)
MKRVLLGTGFSHPPDTFPLANLRPWIRSDSATLAADEDRVLGNANAVLRSWGEQPMSRLGELYGQVPYSFLVTLPVLDPYAPRDGARYFQVVAAMNGAAPRWPGESQRPRVFAYLKPFPALPALLRALDDLDLSALIVAPEVDVKTKSRSASDGLLFCDAPLDMAKVIADCDLAILNGTNATVAQMLQGGKPTLQIPLVLEQVYNARAVQKLGVGLAAAPNEPGEMRGQLEALLGDNRFAKAARSFASGPGARVEPLEAAIETVITLIG